MTASKDYWQKREAENLKKLLKEETKYAKKIEKIYTAALDSIQKDIESFYGRYADKEGITISEAKKRASKLDIEAYSRKAEKYVAEKNFSDQANDEMRLYNLTMKVNRLELLKAEIGLELCAGFDEIEKLIGEKLCERAAEEFKRQAGILGETASDVSKAAAAIANASFYNATFSQRIWTNQTVLKSEISKLLQKGMIQGKNPKVLAGNLRKMFDVSRYDSERLMRTEMARVQTEAQMQSFKEYGYSEYEYICCHKGDACTACKALDGEHFKVKDMMPGENTPPMHPNCHCSTSAWLDEESYNEWLNGYSEHGLSFREWQETREKEARKGKGLGAKIGGEGLVPLHDEPKLLKKVDYGNRGTVRETLKTFEKSVIMDTKENACVILSDGSVYKCYGVGNRVYPDYDFGEKLKNASVTHNHPIDETLYSFSDDDLALFIDYNLKILRGCDEKYTYEFTRDAENIDNEVTDWRNFETFQHEKIKTKAKESGIGYRRWKNE
jgi:SPP1 gp7 family putative phage head morphogenesis protein